jgi:glycosyltransferase involved in cell wall biosynthesis
MKVPLISVIIPVYNCERTIERAVESVLQQTYPNLEIIIVNDNSTDKTRDVAKAIASRNPKVKLVEAPDDMERFDRQTGRNINAGWSARNEGFKHAKGELITFQDADDESFLNRIEIQYKLLKEHDALHVTTDWIQFHEKYSRKRLDLEMFMADKADQDLVIGPEEIAKLGNKTKGLVAKISPALNRAIPFRVKRMRVLNKLFFGSLESYPGIPGVVLFKKEVLEKVLFRRRKDRVWPSFMGRGADRDFNFQVAETFGRSYVFLVPLYLWRVPKENPRYVNGIERFVS